VPKVQLLLPAEASQHSQTYLSVTVVRTPEGWL